MPGGRYAPIIAGHRPSAAGFFAPLGHAFVLMIDLLLAWGWLCLAGFGMLARRRFARLLDWRVWLRFARPSLLGVGLSVEVRRRFARLFCFADWVWW